MVIGFGIIEAFDTLAENPKILDFMWPFSQYSSFFIMVVASGTTLAQLLPVVIKILKHVAKKKLSGKKDILFEADSGMVTLTSA